MTDDDDTTATGGTPPTQPGGSDPEGPASLADQLQELKDRRAAAAAEQLDANITDLEKLISDADKADEDYAKAHQALTDQEARLKSEANTLSDALKAALGGGGIDGVKATVAAETKKIEDAREARDTARTAATDAKAAADAAAEELAEAQATLDLWRKMAANASKRLTLAEALVGEIKTLRNSGRREEAYWKLALGGTSSVPGQNFLLEVLDGDPPLIAPDALRGKIVAAWKDLREKRTTSALAAAELATAKDELKTAEKTLSDLEKNLIKAITDALAAREDASDAA